ncbi:MAG TPA: hypothetical protein VMS11_02820 [Solirubrobacterales bacterium]|nr:hypothetical protein [Solirubrobacterales bacterium]
MDPGVALKEFADFAVGIEVGGLKVHKVSSFLDERQDGEPVTRVLLLVDDPREETWELDTVIELRRLLGRKAIEIGLPSVSVSLVPESEADSVETFVR